MIGGRLAHDPVRLAGAPVMLDHVSGDLPAVQPRMSRSAVLRPQMGANDWAPDCTGESLREYASAVAALNGYDLGFDVAASLAFYLDVKGLAPTADRGAIIASEGAQMLDVAQRQWRSGLPKRVDATAGQDRLYGLFGTVPVSKRDAWFVGAQLCGALWAGVRIHERDQETFYSAAPWDVDDRDPGRLVALHAIVTCWEWTGVNDGDEAVTVTWGAEKPTKLRWLAARSDEIHALRFRQLDAANTPAIDAQALNDKITAWSATA